MKKEKLKQFETLANRVSEILRKEGIWALPEGIDERKDGIIKLHIEVWPRKVIEKAGDHLPTTTIIRARPAGDETSYKLYEIPELEIRDNPFVEKE